MIDNLEYYILQRKSRSNWKASKLDIPNFSMNPNFIKFCKEEWVYHIFVGMDQSETIMF